MVKFVLSYFGIMGRGEPIRLAFVQSGLPFTNKAFGFEDFQKVKSTLPCGQLPVLEIEDGESTQIVDQSNAILRYVGTMGGLYPKDPLLAMKVDQAIDIVEEANKYLSFTLMGPKGIFFQDATLSDDEKVEIRKKILDPGLGAKNGAFFLAVLEKMVDSNKSGWLVGDDVSIADLRAHQVISWLMSGILDGVPSNCMDAYPLLKALHDRVEALPAIAAFRSKYGKKYTTFDYVPTRES